MKFGLFRAIAFAPMMLCGAGAYADRVWNYTSYEQTGLALNGGNFRLTEPDGAGNATVYIVTGMRIAYVCLHGGVPAVVTEDADATVVLIPPVVRDCETRRYTIKKDGSGGFLEVLLKRGWVRSPYDFGLTPKS